MKKATKSEAVAAASLQPRKSDASKSADAGVHIYNDHVLCVTDGRGYRNHRDRSPLEIRVDASEGFIPLWDENVTLRYRFQERSIRRFFENPEAAKGEILRLFGEAIGAWGDAAPVKFTHDEDASDFEFVMIPAADCDASGCVLASAFFPDAGRHELQMYPTMFEQSHAEQVDTFVHEIGHVFGLRHFFANISETQWPSRLFGTDNAFSIMNYGSQSVLTDADKSDLKKLYRAAWSGELTEIDGAAIRLVRPFSSQVETRRPHALAAAGLESTAAGAARAAGPIQIVVGNRRISIE